MASADTGETRPLAGTLYVVATPIGNLEDVSLRALRVLREAAIVAAEDTRHTRTLLRHYDIATPLVSYREQNRDASTPVLMGHLESGNVALVSDAGMPGISDPGVDLVRAVAARGGRVEVVPGPNAALTALVASGLSPAPFLFVGFLSRQRGDRRAYLATLAARGETLVFYEAPHRLLETLHDLSRAFGDRPAAACRELTKLHEEVRRDTLDGLIAHFTRTPPRGEFTVVVAGAPDVAPAVLDDDALDAALRDALARGDDMRRVVADLAAASERPRRAVYARWQALRRGP